ncbi:MAG TPA: sulfite exporter TauE/SafE family protein [Xanthobacteraceae bacterium]|nr:sulfite exporter TauE/SafE family protein [Xanthobacteraceae bacterium]
MPDAKVIFIGAVFVLAGVVKGVTGLGLPTVSMGLLAAVMTPLQAAALVVLPTFLTNIWQLVAGPSLKPVILRLWPMMAAICLGTLAGAGLMTGPYARYGTLFLGVTLVVYALTALASLHIKVAKAHEPWLGPVVGAVTGVIAAATGVFMIPSVPYLQAIGFDKEDFVQALGLTFTVSTIALSINLALAGALRISLAGPTLGVLAMAALGMWAGQELRLRLSPQTFRRWFLIGLALLGIYLMGVTLA